MSDNTLRRLNLWMNILGLVAIGLLSYLTVRADDRYVERKDYDRDQLRLEKTLDEIRADVKALLRRN